MNIKKIAAMTSVVMMVTAMTGCGASVPDNKVFSADDLDGKVIGVQLGTTGDIYASDKENDKAGTTIDRYNKGADAIQALSKGKVDAVIIDEQPAKAFVEKNKDLKILDDTFAEEEYAICISKENTELTETFNKAIQTLKDEGTLDEIISNYIGDDTKGKHAYEPKKDADHSKGKLVMVTNAQFEPYEYYEGEDIVGIDVEMAQAICDLSGYELEIQDVEFDSIITAVSSGKADFGAAGMTVTEDRLKNIDFTDTYTKSKQVIVVRKK